MEIYIHAKQLPIKFIKVFLFLLIPFTAFTQTVPLINSRLLGTVVDSTTKQGIPGVVILIKGTTHSVSTGSHGEFSFVTGQKFPYTLVISFIGYKTKEVIADGSPINIQLAENISQLNDV